MRRFGVCASRLAGDARRAVQESLPDSNRSGAQVCTICSWSAGSSPGEGPALHGWALRCTVTRDAMDVRMSNALPPLHMRCQMATAAQAHQRWIVCVTLAGPQRSAFDEVMLNAAKGLAVVLIGAGCWNVLPGLRVHSVDHAIGLLSAKDPFLVRSGLSRLNVLLASEAEARKLVDRGIHKTLVAFVKEDSRRDVVLGAVQVLGKLSEYDSVRRPLQQTELMDRLTDGMEKGWLDADDVRDPVRTILWKLRKG